MFTRFVKSFLSWRIKVLDSRIEALESYLKARSWLDEKLARNTDWLVRSCLFVRRIVSRFFFGLWLSQLRARRYLWDSTVSKLSQDEY